jgi:6,7-dimethyl-8-ribityllumazine synthase
MSNAPPPRPRVVAGKRRFVIVSSKFNARYVQGLVDHAIDEFRKQIPEADLVCYQVPGAFEIPVVVQDVAANKQADAILAIGVILKGHTEHAENLGRSVTDALQRIALERGLPVIHCVLSLNSEEQARERCLEESINRGREAARTAIEMANVMADLHAKP